MAQHDYNIANQTFPNTRSDINNALSAVASNNSGTAAPSTTFANQWFYETDTNKLQIRNEDNDAFIQILELDQSNDKLIGLGDSISIATTGGITITTADNTDTLSLTSTDTDASAAPILRLSRDNNSAAASDVIGKIIFTGEDAGNNLTDYAEFLTQITDASDGSEDIRFIIKGMVGGNYRKLVDFNTGETSFNDDSDDVDFRVESNGNTHMLFIDAGNDHVNIGTATDLGATLNVSGTGHFETTGNETTLTLKSTDADASSGPRLLLNRESSSPADGDDLGKIFFFGKNDNAEDQGYAEILAEISDASDGTEDGRLVFNMRQAGATTEAIRCEGSNGVVVN